MTETLPTLVIACLLTKNENSNKNIEPLPLSYLQEETMGYGSHPRAAEQRLLEPGFGGDNSFSDRGGIVISDLSIRGS
jgi:hypothetical protein